VQEAFIVEKLSQFEILRRDQEALRYQFISTELDLALTFIGISRSTDDEERSERNLNHAKKAAESAKKYLRDANLSTAKREELVEKLQKFEVLFSSYRRGSQT
jgi:hypothetical protein